MRLGHGGVCLVWVLVTLAACIPPPPPSAETKALEQWLLTADEVGAGFEETYRGTAGFDEGKLCPSAADVIPEHGVVKVDLERGSDSDRAELSEILWVVEPGEMDRLFATFETAQLACDGQQWRDYGDVKTFTAVVAPDLGDGCLAGRLQFGDDPEQGWQEFTVTVRHGDILAEFILSDEAAGSSEGAAISDDEFYAIVSGALAKLPD
ncbi:MAG: hypothetical protein OES24_08625 [Acidimicrobiia bacterium]|nr:hypothetical protein [Acidimicrobiia bacterium]